MQTGIHIGPDRAAVEASAKLILAILKERDCDEETKRVALEVLKMAFPTTNSLSNLTISG